MLLSRCVLLLLDALSRDDLQAGIDVLHIDCDGFLLFFALNARDAHVQVTVRASAKVMKVRSGDGILKDDPALALQPPFDEQMGDAKRATPPSSGLRFEAKWKVYSTTAALPPQSQRLLLVMSPHGYQSHPGRIVFTAGELVHQPPTMQQQQQQRSIRTWLGGASAGISPMDSDPTGIFDSQPLDKGFFFGERASAADDGMQAAVEQSIMQAAMDQSMAEQQLVRVMQQAQEEEEARQLQMALAVSKQAEDLELQAVIERSRASRATALQPIVEVLSSDDDADVQVISTRISGVEGSSLYDMGFAQGANSPRRSFRMSLTPTAISHDVGWSAAAVRNAIRAADGNLDQALELLLNGLEPSDGWNEPQYVDDDDNDEVQIVQPGGAPVMKRARHCVDDAAAAAGSNDSVPSSALTHDIGHVFVDFSNVSVREEDIPALSFIACSGLGTCQELVVVGSQTEAVGHGRFEMAWKALGYSAHFQQKLARQPESFVDDSLVAHIQRALLQHEPQGRVIVLVSGDCRAATPRLFECAPKGVPMLIRMQAMATVMAGNPVS